MAHIKIIYTGGTIGSVASSNNTLDREYTKKNFENILKNELPSWTKYIDWEVKGILRKLSEQIEPQDWVLIAETADKAIQDGFDGLVIAHGTDTLLYTAAALSFMLQAPPIPIVITGSNLPINNKSTDAIQNLSHALYFAAKNVMNGVFISFAGTKNGDSVVLNGRYAKKIAVKADCFQPVIHPPIGHIKSGRLISKPTVQYNVKYASSIFHPTASIGYRAIISICSSLAYFTLYPGFDTTLISYSVEKGAKAVILSAYGVGTVCTSGKFSIIDCIKEIIQKRIPVFVVSQHYGTIKPENYESSALLKKEGVIPLIDTTPEVAIALVMWALSQTTDYDKVAQIVNKSL